MDCGSISYQLFVSFHEFGKRELNQHFASRWQFDLILWSIYLSISKEIAVYQTQ